MPEPWLKSFFSPTQLPILCVGDIMLDVFVQGEVKRISPEAPIPVFKYIHEQSILGGVGNVVRNLEGLNIPSILIGLLGDDDAGHTLERMIQQSPSITSHFIKCAHLKTTKKTRFTAGVQQLLRVDRESPESLLPEHIQKLKKTALESLKDVNVIVLSDYSKGVLSKELLTPLIQEALKMGKIIIVDPKGKDYSRYQGASLLTPNREELHLATDMPTNTDEDCILAAQKLIDAYQIQSILVTRGAQGMTLVTGAGLIEHSRATAVREVFDVSGAGDTVVAVMATALNAGLPLETAMHFANTAGSIVVGKIGTSPIEHQELFESLTHQTETNKGPTQKILSLPQLVDLRLKWQRRGLKVGFTNGCFDLLHPGHLYILEQSKAKCDRLIVGLNSDLSVKGLKGDSRPLQSEEGRALVLAALEMVDGIVLFSDSTPHTLITTLKPDVLVKGADYTIDQVVGAREVLSYGGEVHLVDLVPNQSTTNLVKKMANE